jgi:hypothetical protein
MMVFMYFCVMLSAISPRGEDLARYYVGQIEESYRAMVEGRNTLADTIADLRTSAR